ncbi:MAG: tetratricopeptide repeat protein [Acidobacteria bacterium]|nr:tetratricopeptide repeat protein [Acidobacteriota bacterium]
MLDLANGAESTAPRQALSHAVEGLALAVQLGDREKELAFLTSAAFCCSQTGDLPAAVEFGKKALALGTELGHKDRIAKAHNALGITYTFMGAYSQALEEGLEALRIREELGQERAVAQSLNLIGAIHHQSGQHEKAIEYFNQVLARSGTPPDAKRLILAKLNIGFAQLRLGRLTEALKNQREALALCTASGETAHLTYAHLNLGMTYTELRNFNLAARHLQQAEAGYREQNQKHGLVQALHARARLHLLTGEFARGIPLAKEGAELARSIHARDELKKAYEMVSELYEKTGNVSEAFRFYKLATLTKDSIYSLQESHKIAEISMKIVTLKKDNEIDALRKEKIISNLRLEKQNYFIIIFILSSFFLAIIIILLARHNKNIRNNRKLLEQTNDELAFTNKELQEKMNEIKTLGGLLPICAQCKKIRDDEGYWNQLEGYISARTSATFTHGICPNCAEELYPGAMEHLRASREGPPLGGA